MSIITLKIAKAGHKHYVCFTDEHVKEAVETGYEIHEMNSHQLYDSWEESNSLRFINDWPLERPPIVAQFAGWEEAEKAIETLYREQEASPFITSLGQEA